MHPLAPLVLAPLALVSVLAVPGLAQESPDPCAPGPGRPVDCDGSTATASPTPVPTAVDRPCPTFTVEVAPDAVAGTETTVRLTPDSPREDVVYGLRLTRQVPEPVAVVREAASTGTATTTFRLRLGETHRLLVEAYTTSRGDFCLPAASRRVDVPVLPIVTLAARRTAPRDYAFTGRVLPGRGQAVSLYRVAADGTRVLTSRTVVAPDGTYRVDRRFAGSGRSVFVATVAASTASLAGASAPRPTVVH